MYKSQRTQLPLIQQVALSKKANTSHKRSYSRDYRMLHLPRIAHFELSMEEDKQANRTSGTFTGHRRSESWHSFKDTRFSTQDLDLDFSGLADSEDDENTETQVPVDVSSIIAKFTKRRSRSTSKKLESVYAPSHTRESGNGNNITKEDSTGNGSQEGMFDITEPIVVIGSPANFYKRTVERVQNVITPNLRRRSPPRPVPVKFFSQKAGDLMGIRPLNRSETCARALGLRY